MVFFFFRRRTRLFIDFFGLLTTFLTADEYGRGFHEGADRPIPDFEVDVTGVTPLDVYRHFFLTNCDAASVFPPLLTLTQVFFLVCVLSIVFGFLFPTLVVYLS